METENAEKVLLEQMLNDPSLSGLLEKCAQMLGSPLRYTYQTGSDGSILSEGYPYVDAIQGQMLLEARGVESDETFQLFMEQLEAENGQTPYLLVPEDPHIPRRLLCLVRVGTYRSGILALPELKIPLEQVDPSLMALCARCIGLRMNQLMMNSDSSAVWRGMYLLTVSQRATYRDVAGHAGSSMLPRKDAYRLLVIRGQGEADGPNLGTLSVQIARLFSTEWHTVIRREALVLFRDAMLFPEAAEQMEQLLAVGGCCGCLSPAYHSLMDTFVWRKRVNELPAFQHASPGELVLYKHWLDWGIFGETGMNREQLTAFLPAEVHAIREWDRSHGTEYMTTLAAFVQCFGKHRQTAAALNTHVNTVNYRLQKMEELFGLDFSAPETPCRLAFAVRLMAYLDQMK